MPNPTAAIIITGNEILSGRTRDANVSYIATKLFEVGIKLFEVRMVSDTQQAIVKAVCDLKDKYDYVLTTGGIGSTHDDVTTASIAVALGLPLELNDEVLLILKSFYDKSGQAFPKANEKMAYLPRGSKPIENNICAVPSFFVENIYVMAGVPDIMHVMLDYVIAKLKHGSKIFSKSVDVMLAESKIAEDFALLQDKYPEIEMGSYPFKSENQQGTSLVLSSTDVSQLEIAYKELLELVQKL